MKKAVLFSTLCLLIGAMGCKAKSPEEKAIKEVITAFSKAGDDNNASKLDELLDDNYRIVMNRLFGSKTVNVMPKNVYLEKIKSKEFGGDTRRLSFGGIEVNGNTASAQVSFNGTKMSFDSIIVLVKNESNQWKLVSEVPVMKQ